MSEAGILVLVLESKGEEDDSVGEDEGDMAAMSSELRQRRPYVEPESESVEEEEKGEKGEAGSRGGARKSAGPGWVGAFVFLMIARYYSASYNIIHDCDEVFNYWEPLHYLLYKSGFQTWEYSSEFALRSYLYLLLHAAVGGPSFWFYGAGFSKVQVFFTLRLALGFLSAVTEATLVAVVTRRYGARMGMYTLGILCISSGCFNASTSMFATKQLFYVCYHPGSSPGAFRKEAAQGNSCSGGVWCSCRLALCSHGCSTTCGLLIGNWRFFTSVLLWPDHYNLHHGAVCLD